ncbi:MAG: 3-oxoacyl-[acyl-carrier-protein] reductase [Chlamydiae bacterium]|nr:3-oxoacyl-[acyl-carrier-protein] reductase [Chlamydiota bacterium]
MQRLVNKHVVITGGTRGIGRGIAEVFVKEGAHVYIIGTNDEKGKEAVLSLSQFKIDPHQKIEFFKVDVSHKGEVENFSEVFLKKAEKIDVLINNAGVTRDGLLMKMKEEDWDTVIDTNLKSVYNMSSSFVRTMIKQRAGSIINISSVVGIKGNPGQVNYAASKAGMIGFTKSLAKEVASRNITVNCIAPGGIATDMLNELTDTQKESLLKDVPMGKFGMSEDIAYAALFLAGDESRYVTGQVIAVDGGMTA